MRVLHVISSLDARAGGPAVALAGLAGAQAGQGVQVSLLATFREGENRSAAEQLQSAGVKVSLIGPGVGPLVRHPQIAPALEHLVADADVVHIHALWEQAQHQAARAARRHRIPYVVRPCGMLTPWSLAQSKWRKKLYMLWRLRDNLLNAAALHFTSRIERATTAPFTRSVPAIVEPNGVDLGEFETLPQRGSFRRLHPQLSGRPVIAFLGRIHPGKGLEYLIPALARMKNTESMLLVIGPDSQGFEQKMQAVVEDHKLRERVVFVGMLRGEERVAALADADLFALPSDHENFGIAVVEALATGTPVVISDHVGICEEVRAAGVGSVVRRDVEEIARELDRWLDDTDLRASAAARARDFVWEYYDWSKIARRWSAHYEQLARATGAPLVTATGQL